MRHGVVGDISNTLVTFEPLAREPAGGGGVPRADRLQRADPERVRRRRRSSRSTRSCRPTRVRASLAAHAPYSVAPLVFARFATRCDRRPFLPCSVHLAESAEEVEFIRSGGGPWRDAARGARRRGTRRWEPPGVRAGGVPRRARLSDAPRARRARRAVDRRRPASGSQRAARRSSPARAATARPAPARRRSRDFYASGVRVAIGTDSLASAPDLNVFAELADDARARAATCRRRRCSRAPRCRAPARSASTPTSARSSPASAAPPDRRRAPGERRRCGRISGRRHRAGPDRAGSEHDDSSADA